MMKHLTISKKLLMGFGIILALMVISAVLSLSGISRIENQVNLYANYTVPNNTSVGTMRHDLVSLEQEVLEAFISENSQYRKERRLR